MNLVKVIKFAYALYTMFKFLLSYLEILDTIVDIKRHMI
jgi:hypothetical protein